MNGVLYMLPVRIGDRGKEYDLPQYNIEVMHRLRHYVVENARTARQYLRSLFPDLDLNEIQIIEVDKHNGYSYPRSEVMALLHQGVDIGFMSEAGCPGIADPGHLVVKDCHAERIRVVPLIGPSSITLALMASGCNGQSFAFHGYLPYDEAARRRVLDQMVALVSKHNQTQIFIEAPYRNDRLLRELSMQLPPTIVLCMAVDLTGQTEEIHRHTIKEWRSILGGESEWHKRPAIFVLGQA